MQIKKLHNSIKIDRDKIIESKDISTFRISKVVRGHCD